MANQLYHWQEECLQSWFEHETRGCVNAVTGAGKTYLAMHAIARLEERCPRPLRVKVVVPTVAIMNQWLRVFRAFFSERRPEDYNRMETGCWYGGGKRRCRYMIYVINSARDVLAGHIRQDVAEGRDVLLIADEYHHYGSPENRKIFEFLPLPDMSRFHALGLSATPAEDLACLGPVIYHYDFARAREQRRVCPFSIMQVALSFSAGELEEYEEYSSQMAVCLARLKKEHPYLRDISGPAFFAAVRRLASDAGGADEAAGMYLNMTYLRKGIVHMAQARIDCLLALLPHLDPDSRVLIFCERIEQAEAAYRRLLPTWAGQLGICHSKRAREANRDALRAFREHETRILLSCRSLDEGVDVPDANVGIVLSCTSARRQRVQRLGRILRIAQEKDYATLYYFYVRQSAEDGAYFAEDGDAGAVCRLSFHALDGTFQHNAYETAARRLLEDLSAKTSDPQKLAEARRRLLEGLALPDWLASPEYCDRRIASTQDTKRRNYWICMKKMAAMRAEDRIREFSSADPLTRGNRPGVTEI